MSYILEALKKAQAERQLGATPTIHAPQLHSAADGAGAGAVLRKPLWLALALLGVAVVAMAVMMWRQARPGAVLVVAPAPAQTQQAAPPTAAAPSLPPVARRTRPQSRDAAPAPAMKTAPAPLAANIVTPPAAKPAEPAAAGNPAPLSAAASDDNLPAQRELPDPIQQQIPPVAIGGYIYSKNPADRLLLIDKILRHEGEELAPGLTLERLLPKAAIFNFRGYRYRVPYY
ncbi:MAG TPA: general secretion pathway protein GspB [Janthinobacterium sp.]|jgi:general secretion pathway protein B|nr:general secretion pathway protein GspB [Janthinobacterium sp.]